MKTPVIVDTVAQLRAALKWALRGNHVTDYTSGFSTCGCGCCSHDTEPPEELDALLREVRFEMLREQRGENQEHA